MPGPADENHAVVVGINHYAGGIRPLQGSVNDCELFSEWLLDPNGGNVPDANLKRVYSAVDSPRMPGGEQIEERLQHFFDRSNEIGRPVGNRLYLFFAGHGVAKEMDRTALVTANAVLNFVRGFIGDLASTKVQSSGLFREVVLVMDCCRDVFEPNGLSLRCELPDMTDTSRRTNWMTVYAADWGSTTAEKLMDNPLDRTRPQLWHGVLTHVLLRGLLTAGDDRDKVSAATLKQFVDAVMKAKGGEASRPPARVLFDAYQPMLEFGTATGCEVTVTLASGGTAPQVLDHAFNPLAVAMQSPAAGVFSFKLKPPRLYLVRSVDAAGATVAEKTIHVLEEPLHVEL